MFLIFAQRAVSASPSSSTVSPRKLEAASSDQADHMRVKPVLECREFAPRGVRALVRDAPEDAPGRLPGRRPAPS